MDFIFTDQLLHLSEEREVVLVYIAPSHETQEKQIKFHFPTHRFRDFETKKNIYIKNINGTFNKDYILSKADSYQLYANFYAVFY